MIGFLARAWRHWRLSRCDTSGMRAIPAGRVSFDEGRRVRVRSFLLDEYPVTNRAYRSYIRATGARRPAWLSRPGFDDPDQPVVGVSYTEALDYARWVGKRLPTECEWVRAARGDDRRPYPWGDTAPVPGLAWTGQRPPGAPALVGEGERAAGVGPFGHRDLIGNVWEWCQDATLRGGFWGSKSIEIDSRLDEEPRRESAGYGFRCAL